MTAAELDRIEAELNLVVPRSYREFMQSGKFGEGFEGIMGLTGVAQEVIDMTKDLRANGFYGSGWPLNFLVIGDDGAGDYYFTDVTKERPAVQFADHELTTNKNRLVIAEKQRYETFASFWKFIDEINTAHDLAFKRQQERRKNKRWWQFWIS